MAELRENERRGTKNRKQGLGIGKGKIVRCSANVWKLEVCQGMYVKQNSNI